MFNRSGATIKLWLTALFCVVGLFVRPLEAQEPRQQRILALYATTPGAAGAMAFETTYQKLFSEALGMRVDFQSEYIELARFSEQGYSAALVEFLRYKYRQLPPDVVIATTEASRRFAEQYRAEIFPEVPIVFIERVSGVPREANTTGIRAPLDLGGSIDLALTLQPGTEHVFVINGLSQFDSFYAQLAREQLKRFETRVDVTYWSELTLAELERATANLPPNSIVFFLTFGEDRSGARFVSLDARDRVVAVANAPMYAWNDVAIGHDIVGGRLFTNEIVAARSAEVALRILGGEKAADIAVATIDATLTTLDWRQLRRWNISESRVPADATIVFREPTLWDRYKLYISGALVLFLLQSALIAGLLIQSARRRRAETKMREHQQMLEASNRQISELFGRLIAAQETERTRIARDLHDDVSQRIAGLSIAMSGLKRMLARNQADPGISAVLDGMQRDATTLAEEIRHLSHDLHPSALQHSGLVSALSAVCSQFEIQQRIAVTYRADSDVGIVDRDSALGLYRITQEALHNIAKHAAAQRVDVTLSRSANGLQLSIADDGRGFNPAHPRGLGLVSIDERARLLGGFAEIATQPGRGTLVRVEIPGRSVTLSVS